jgi:uncharacterized protein GlcG (DUF336 family)
MPSVKVFPRLLVGTFFIGTFCLMTGAPWVYADEATVFYTARSLSVEMASKAAWAALTKCRGRGYSVAVAVVDRGGNVQALLRDRFAGPHTPETAIRKAWTANSFRQSTAELAGLLAEKRIPSQVANNPGALLVGGGLVIEAGGSIVGGIGVSGAPPGKSERDSIDGSCAQAGIEAIGDAMEFAQ